MKMILGSAEMRALLSLLAFEMFGTEMQINPSEVDWRQVLDAGRKHAVSALLYPGIRRLEGIPEEIVDAVRSAAALSSMQSERMLRIQGEIVQLLEKNHIDNVILKGTGVARCYPHPELRMPGDIDILVSPQRLDEACRLLEAEGYSDLSSTIIHNSLSKDGVDLEIHHKTSTFPDNEKGRYTENLMQDALKHTEPCDLNGVGFRVLMPKYQLVSQLSHMERHMGNTGISLRQLCDWQVTIHFYRDQLNSEMTELLSKCGLLKFARVMTRVGERYLGLPAVDWENETSEILSGAAMQDILSVGNFTEQQRERHISSVMMANRRDRHLKRRTIFGNYINSVREIAENSFPWAKSPLWLPVFIIFLPIRWCYRVLSGQRKKVNVIDAVKTARERINLMQEMELYQ